MDDQYNLTPAMIRALELAHMQAKKEGAFTGVDHVLFGIMQDGDNFGARTLKEAGFTVEGLRNKQGHSLSWCERVKRMFV